MNVTKQCVVCSMQIAGKKSEINMLLFAHICDTHKEAVKELSAANERIKELKKEISEIRATVQAKFGYAMPGF